MKIKMCAFIPSSLGRPMKLCDLPKNLMNQKEFESQVNKIKGYWLNEPYPATVLCETDNRDFGNLNGTNRLYAYNEFNLDLSKTGTFQKLYGSKAKIFLKKCDLSGRAFVQLATKSLNAREFDRIPKMEYQGGGGKIVIIDRRKKYGYMPPPRFLRGEASQKLDQITDITPNHTQIRVEAGGGYPFLEPFSPDIDFSFTIDIYRLPHCYRVEINGRHNKFPCYEMYINSTLAYKYRSSDKAPSPINLNTTTRYRVVKRFLK